MLKDHCQKIKSQLIVIWLNIMNPEIDVEVSGCLGSMGEMSERCQNVVELECQPVLANVTPSTRYVLIPYVWWWICARQEHKNNTTLASFGLSWPMMLLVLEMCWIGPRDRSNTKLTSFGLSLPMLLP